MLLSICIPSYNRGKRALDNVQNLLQISFYDEIEIIVSNNGSNLDLDEYHQIRDIGDDRVKYYEFERNMHYTGNLNKVIKMSTGRFCLILSDEDSLNIENIGKYMGFLLLYDKTAVAKASVEKWYPYDALQKYRKGLEAINEYYMYGNYVSGLILNRTVISNKVIEFYEANFSPKTNSAYYYYPHMMYETHAMLCGDFLTIGIPLITPGSEDSETDETAKPMVYGTADQRLAQMKGFFDQIEQFHLNNKTIESTMVKKVIDKTSFLIPLQKSKYLSDAVDWGELVYQVKEEMCEIIRNANIDVIQKDIKSYERYALSSCDEMLDT